MTDKMTGEQALDGFRIDISPKNGRADIVLDRAPYNVISMAQRNQLCAAFEELDRDSRVRVIVLRSNGEHFSSGGNVAAFMEAAPEQLSMLGDNIAAPARCSKPVIAAVRGYCFGVGFELSLACDFRVASDTAQFALPEMNLGMIPGSGGSARLLHMIGITRTKNMVMRAKRIDGRKGESWGFVTECVPDDKLESTVEALVAELVRFSPLAQRTIKRVLNAGQNTTVDAAIELEGGAYGRLRSSTDFREGVAAFTGKRKPEFTGR